MNKQRFNILCRIVIVIGIAFNIPAFGQATKDTIGGKITGDSISLVKIISIVVQNHPSVKEMAEAINYADATIGMAKSGYYPNADVEASYTRLGPADKLSIPMLGSFELYPVDNYSASLNFVQSIYDFGKTANNVKYANEVKNLNELSVAQVKQKLATTVTSLYYMVVYLQEAIIINKEQLKTLNEHLDFIKKKKETGSATQYEILSTQVRILNVESLGIDLQQPWMTN